MAMVLRGGRVVAAGQRGVIENGVVVVDGTRIASVGEDGEFALPREAEVVDVKGRTIMPGLIDLHTHISAFTDAETREGINARTVTEAVVRGVENLQRCTALGVTTIRDLGCKHTGIFALRRATASGDMVGPRIITCGAAIAMTGGHGYNSVANEADGPEGVRALTREQLKLGADVVKLMASGGAGTAGERVNDVQLTVEELKAAVDEAHKKGKLTAAHATHYSSVNDCLEAGVDSIEHGLILNEECVARMVAAGAYFVPTLEAYERIVRLGKAVYPAYFVPKAETVLGPHKEAFQMAVKAGVKIAAGTDSGGHFWRAGDMANELQRMVEFGLAPEQAIRTATANAANALGMADSLGALEAGKLADILVVDGNPLDDIATLAMVWLVMKEGSVQVSPR